MASLRALFGWRDAPDTQEDPEKVLRMAATKLQGLLSEPQVNLCCFWAPLPQISLSS